MEEKKPIPKLAVIMLLFVCVASITTAARHWYSSYFLQQENEPQYAQARASPLELDLPIISEPLQTALPTAESDLSRVALDIRPIIELAHAAYGNHKIIGEITLPTAGADTPLSGHTFVSQATNNYFFKNHTVCLTPCQNGSHFLHYAVDIYLDLDMNVVIYAAPETSLANLIAAYIDYDFFLRHPVIGFNTKYMEYDWEIFSFYIATPDFGFDIVTQDYTNWGYYVAKFTEASLYNTRLDVTEYDQVITFATPAVGRPGYYYVLQGRLLRFVTS